MAIETALADNGRVGQILPWCVSCTARFLIHTWAVLQHPTKQSKDTYDTARKMQISLCLSL